MLEERKAMKNYVYSCSKCDEVYCGKCDEDNEVPPTYSDTGAMCYDCAEEEKNEEDDVEIEAEIEVETTIEKESEPAKQ
jgi:hypothetical protein